MTLEQIAWFCDHIRLMSLGGTWAIPRCGLVVQKTGSHTFAVILAMPWQEGMPISAEQLKKIQDDEVADLKKYCSPAGITVEDRRT